MKANFRSSPGEPEEAAYWDDPDLEVLEDRKPRRGFIAALAAASLVLTFALFQNTFAGNISINTSGQLEFGQGTQRFTSCSGATPLTVSPSVSFANASGGGTYFFSAITVSNIPAGCNGSAFTFNAYSDTGTSALALFNSTSTDAIVDDNNGVYGLGPAISGMSVVTNSSSSFTLTFTSPVTPSKNVAKLSLQSSAIPCATTLACAVGNIGPGGGVVFYYSAASFAETGAACSPNCHYLEQAPRTWSGGAIDPTIIWAVPAYQSGGITSYNGSDATGVNIGTGFANTAAIVHMQGAYNASTNNYAAGAAAAYSGGGMSDWFMPSQAELAAMYSYSQTYNDGFTLVGVFSSYAYYWSSSFAYVSSGGWARDQNFANGNQYNGTTNAVASVRPIRAF